ncbi:hypothetical protein GGQ92_001351 [Gracilibacillus halotolerans]|uniref:Uncharacterized protein n=1 Tax=Gracilibacillus halotolerans TaxID=74386 RepID=A0A841RN17_9BACI|nr:hypothetical protein [Gracilibacillus halotolerans]MBB6512565.1 hypothetical protein [Gracilibacillus halotolerans]
MIKRIILFLLFASLIVLLITSVILQPNHKKLAETLTVKTDNITHLKITNLAGEYRTTTDPQQIQYLIDYLNTMTYKRLVDDQTAFMPTRTIIIYLFEGEKVDFIIPYGQEAMINRKVYQIEDGYIESNFLADFHDALLE